LFPVWLCAGRAYREVMGGSCCLYSASVGRLT
jgi:hypothetical protein